ncbi:TraK domain-containing protein [Burkholderia cenocepacia]|uniref:TraK domain-containing protein n=1 Tax=Burkholderia cenocepacia TaxID=95486 RepID=UPI002B2417BF|nr:type-F conjugative transfer system secretin TraK [Burkholderia cenocepacia]MEB2500736.1 type-F conjugative transfer system secretin TraK [Burkholderia cenocepacia]MEB2558252.1 type-F conjugative transfer system secretin TraK [Burkholderia cenocepacia]
MFSNLRKWIAAATLFPIAAANVLPANAATAGASEPREYTVSATEQNRLEIAGRAIKKVVPSHKGALTYVKDKGNGVFYFAFANGGDGMGTETLYVIDDQGATYQLLLQPRRVPSANIIVPAAGDAPGRSAVARTAATSSAYQSAIKDLVYEMAAAQVDPGADPAASAVPVNQDVPLWKEARLTFDTKYVEDAFVGEQYTLTNVSSGDMVIAEQELYRPGVVVVAVEQQTLAPGDSTRVYIVRERGRDE